MTELFQIKSKTWFLFAFLILPFLSACGGGSKDERNDVAHTTLSIQVISADGGSVEGVSATIDGKAKASSDKDGRITINDLPVERELAIKLQKDGFANQVYRYKSGLKDAADTALVTMIARGESATFSATSAVSIQGEHGAAVTLKGGEFVDSKGEVVSGDIELSMTPVDVSTPAGLEAFPGSFSAIDDDGGEVPLIVTYGTTEFQFTQGGEELQLAEGETAAIELPIFIDTHPDGSPVKLGDEIPLWYLNEETGIWQQEGNGVVVASQASKTGFALRGEVSHFTWWNVDVAPEGTRVRFKVSLSQEPANVSAISARVFALGRGFRLNDIPVTIDQYSSPQPVPANREICFTGTVSIFFDDGERQQVATDEKCVKVAAGKTASIDLVANPDTAFQLTANVAETATVGSSLSSCGVLSRLTPQNYIPPLTFAIESGALPDGLVLDSRTGYITGRPTASAVGDSGLITVKAVDNLDRAASASFSINVSPALGIITGEMPLLTVGEALSPINVLTASGGLSPYSYRLAGSAGLPAGLGLDNVTGEIAGTPKPLSINGQGQAFRSEESQIKVMDANCAAVTVTLTSNIHHLPKLTGTPPAVVDVGSAINFTAQSSEGSVEAWSLNNAPAWLSIDADTGALGGTPLSGDVGIYNDIEIVGRNNLDNAPFAEGVSTLLFNLEVQAEVLGTQNINFEVPGPISRSAGAQPFVNSAAGGKGSGGITYRSSDTGVATVDPDTGEVTPVANGQAVITATKAADAVYSEATASYTLNVENTAPIVESETQITFTASATLQTYSYSPTLVSGEGVSWSLTGNNLPWWLSIDTITGVMTTAEIDQFEIGVYDGITLNAENALGSTQITPITIVIEPDAPPKIATSIANNKLVIPHNHFSDSIVFENAGGVAQEWTVSGNFPDAASGWLAINDRFWAPPGTLNINPDIQYLGTHSVTVTATNTKGSDSITFDLEITLDVPRLYIRGQVGEIDVNWRALPVTPVEISYDLYISDQPGISPETFDDATADVINGYNAADTLTSVNGADIALGQTYHMMLVANYAGLQSRSGPMQVVIGGVHDSGMKYCHDGVYYNFEYCGNSQYPAQDGDLGRDAANWTSEGYYQLDFNRLDANGQAILSGGTPECIRDNVTGQLWQYALEPNSILAADLAAHIATVNETPKCGLTNWRLPTTNELLSIVNYGVSNNGGSNVVMKYSDLQLNSNIWSSPNRYWTSDRVNANGSRRWFVHFRSGHVTQNDYDISGARVILVADTQTTPAFAQRFTDNGDGTVSDSHTGLMWKKCAEGYLYDAGSCVLNAADTATFNWQSALLRAGEVNQGLAQRQNHAYNDWRVPNTKELNSLLRREDQEANMFDASMFPGTSAGQHWTSTPVAQSSQAAQQAWSVGLLPNAELYLGGRLEWEEQTVANAVRLVRSPVEKRVYSWYLDEDGDNYANPVGVILSETKPEGKYISNHEYWGWDCNDNDPNVNESTDEVQGDKVDNNCNGFVDEGIMTGGE